VLIRSSGVLLEAGFRWSRPYVAWVANLKPAKNPESFIALAKALQDSDVDFLMVGSIQSSDYKYVEQPNLLPPNCIYMGSRSIEEVNGILQDSLFLVHTCEPEGFPNVMIQAWQRETPVVSLYYDPDGIIESQGIGYLARDEEGLARYSSRLIRDGELRLAMGARASAFAQKEFDLGRNINKLEKFLAEILEQ